VGCVLEFGVGDAVGDGVVGCGVGEVWAVCVGVGVGWLDWLLDWSGAKAVK
jgi:hypothetical protein